MKFLFPKDLKNVTIISPKNTYIEAGAIIGENTTIYPNNYIKNDVKIGKNCTLFPGNFIENCIIGDNCSIGPNAHIRPKSIICNNVKIGNFCEIKASFVGDSCKISHLSYIGDATLKENINIGCGVVTANFNGKIKQKTFISKNSFIGCNVNLIAPISIGENCYICAGATVDKDLDNNTFLKQNRDNFTAPKKSKK